MFMKKLRCHTDLFSDDLYPPYEDVDLILTKGKEYNVIYEKFDCYLIIDNTGFEHEFTKEPDELGFSYKTWFDLVEEPKDSNIDSMKKFVLKVQQNGGEYHGYVTIKGKVIEKIDLNTVNVDGVEIKFDEIIANIEIKE